MSTSFKILQGHTMLRELLVVLLLSSFVLSHAHKSKPCDHETIMDKFYRENPGEEQRAHELGVQMREMAERYLNASNINLKEASAPVTIPVVFHVLWSSARPELKITAAKVASELTYLNQWYSASNTYYGRSSPYWANQRAVASDYKISFVLASKDPAGNPTTGINFYETAVVNTCGDTEIFRAAQGGADAWNTLQYMNIWTCPLTSGAAGYAYLPGSGTHYRDGIVMDPQYIGYAYASGSILAHEVGHWLGLPHIFTGTANTCSNSDNVADTPMADVYGWDYVSSSVCTNTNGFNALDYQRCGGPTMFQNCMDYNWEECKSFFSKGQVAVMRSWLDSASTIRGGLKNSPGLGSGSCTPNCSGKVCGPNGCGGTCGSCASPATCSTDGTQCVGGPSVTPSPTSSPAAGAPPSSTSTATPTATPTRTPQSGSSSGARSLVIQKINTIRAEVSPPPATPLTPLTYSVPLEDQAKAHAQQCLFAVNAGQVLVRYSGDQTSNLSTLFSNAIGVWNSTKQYYTLTASGSTCTNPNGSCGSYVQMIWDNAQYPTTEVGCGAQYCADANTYVVCQFSGIGNYVGLLPYVPCNSPGCNPNCNSVCSPGQCGIIETECGPLNCGPCCDDPCATNQCGTHMNSCGTAITCSSCAAGSTCTAGASGTTCVQDPVCVHADECAAGGFECGSKVFCGVNQACGFCGNGEICSDFQCVADPCNNCGPNSNCVNSECVCQAGFVLQDGVCTAPSSGTNYNSMFVQRAPTGSVDFVIPDSDLILTGTGPHLLDWATSQNIVDLYTTKSLITVSLVAGEFGFNIRTGQGSGRENDRIMWHVKNVGSNPVLGICLVFYGNNYCSSYSPISFPNPSTVTVTMGYDGANILTTWQVGSGSIWSSAVSESYYPALGSISYLLASTSGPSPVLSNAFLATSSTLEVSLVDCIDDETWENYFYTLTGANPATTTVTREEGDAGNCKGSEAGKIVASGFTLVITSSSVPAAALASQLASTVGSPAGAALGVASASVVSGAAGANAAGFATTIAALSGTTVVAPAVAAGGGGGGGAAGLSGGAIAGIVIGSVAGAVLIVGVTTVVVAAVIVAAVIVAKKASDSNDDSAVESAPPRNEARVSRRIRDTIYDILRAPKGGVDVMNNPGGHQSITARSPQA